MKLLAGIRLVVATVLLVFFSGTMAFAHSGHDHGAPPAKHQSHAASAQKAVVAPQAVAAISTIKLSGQGEKPAAALTQRDGVLSELPCGSGCCCCDGPSNCGMAGGCAAHAMTTSDGPAMPLLSAARLSFAASDIRAGRAAFGLERPPKA